VCLLLRDFSVLFSVRRQSSIVIIFSYYCLDLLAITSSSNQLVVLTYQILIFVTDILTKVIELLLYINQISI
jgi:hypothetical protein